MPGIQQIVPYKSVSILLYHQISESTNKEDRILISIPPDIFRSQMKYLHDREYISITLYELPYIENNKEQDSRKYIDDGYKDP